jgi:hypothetical protein
LAAAQLLRLPAAVSDAATERGAVGRSAFLG